jgi:hypothetical protein
MIEQRGHIVGVVFVAELAFNVSRAPVTVSAHVSGRHPGDDEVHQFVRSLLTRFRGAAQDEYTGHMWSLEEIVSGHRVEGHRFFDYRGWYAERQRDA